MDRTKLALGTTTVLAVSVLSGVVLLRTADGDAQEVRSGQIGFVGPGGGIEVAELDALRRQAKRGERAAELEQELTDARQELTRLRAQLAERVRQLKQKPAVEAPVEKPAAPKPAAVAEPRDVTPKGRRAKLRKMVAGFTWKRSLRAIVKMLQGRRWDKLSVEQKKAISEFNLITANLQRLLKVTDDDQVFADPDVAAVFVPAWVEALGVDLDERQRKALTESTRRDAETDLQKTTPRPTTYLGKMAKNVRESLTFDKGLGELLRPDQMATYLGTVKDDPFFGQGRLSVGVHESSTVDDLIEAVTKRWLKEFELEPALRPTVRARALEFVTGSLGIPELADNLPLAERREARLKRTAQLLELQAAAEAGLAGDPGLSDAERARVKAGSNRIITVRLKG